jgi:L-alanine-DL-glutamate epimerase-like enolase superfamily enzyme
VASVEDAERAVAAGFRTLKLKLGIGPFAEALSLLRALRRAVGWDVALRLDANGALPEASVRDQLGALAELRPEFLEEPTTHWSAALSDSPVPLALDESLLRGIDSAATRLAKVAVLKPMLLGGPKRCLALAEQLIAAGLDVTVSHTWDGPVGLATAATTALAIAGRWPGRVRACGLSRHPGLAAWPERELPYLGTTVLQPNALPGLGVTGGAAA